MPSIQAVLRRRDTIQPTPWLKSKLKKLGPRATVVALQPLDLVTGRALDEDLGERAFGRKKPPPSNQFAPLQRRHSFHTLTDEQPTLLHDLRSYFDPQYRLYLVKKQLLSLVRDDDVSVEEMFDLVDEDFSGVLERDELKKMIALLQIKVKEVEIDTLMDILDEDESGGVDIDEFQDWLFATEDQWLEKRRTREDDEFNDRRLLQRDILRFDADIRGMLGALWDLVDADASGQVDLQEYVTLSVNLQRAVTDDFDLDEATKIARREFEFDAQGCETMDRTLFFWSFFQLADAWRDGDDINSGSYCYFMDFLSDRCTSIETVDGKPTLVWKWSSDPEWYSKIEPMRLVEKRRNARRKKGLPPEPIPTSPLREMAMYNRRGTVVEAPRKKTVKEIAKAAKNAVKARKNQQRRKARRSWDLEQEEKSRLQARADADASYHEAERLRIEMEEARENSMRAKQEKQREAIRRKSEEKALRELEKKEAAAKREALRLEKLGEKQKAAELRDQARKEAQQEQARLKREAAAAREFSLKKKLEDKLRAKAESADRKRRLMEGKVEEAERRRLQDIEAKAAAAKARRRSCVGAPAPAPSQDDDDDYDYRKMLGSIARESYDDFSYASTQPSPPVWKSNLWRVRRAPDTLVDFHTGHHPKIVGRRASRRPRRLRRSPRPRGPTGTRRPTRQATGATGRRRREASRGPFGVMEAK
jgi:chemotaxis protein histidine kinase CheA